MRSVELSYLSEATRTSSLCGTELPLTPQSPLGLGKGCLEQHIEYVYVAQVPHFDLGFVGLIHCSGRHGYSVCVCVCVCGGGGGGGILLQ